MPIIRCPHCDDRVEIEDDWYGRRIACPSCDRQFTPQRGDRDDRDEKPRGRSDDWDDDRDTRDRKYRPGREDDRPRRRRRYDDDPPKKGNAVLWIVLSLVAVFVVLPCVGCIGYVAWFANATQSFDGPWADHSAGTPPVVTASFPKPPVAKFLDVKGSTGGETIGYDHAADGSSPLDVIFAVGYLDFPPGTDPLGAPFGDIRAAVEEEFNVTVIPGVKADLASDRKTTINGHSAREVVYSKDDGGYVLRVIHLTGGAPGGNVRAVVVFGGGVNMKDPDKQKFLNSVKIGGK